MHRRCYLALAVGLAAIAFLAPPASGASNGPQQCSTSCVPPDVPRLALIDAIRASLPPIGARWSVFCTPDSAVHMTCWARNPRAKFVRRYNTAVFQGGFDLEVEGPWSLRSRKTPSTGTTKTPG
jgi:hypothetical protein